MATAVIRVRGLCTGTLNHIDGLSEDIWVEWPDDADTDSCPQIVGTFDEVDDGVAVLKWKQEDGAKGWVGIPLDNVETLITVKNGALEEDEEEDEDAEPEEEEETAEEEDEEPEEDSDEEAEDEDPEE